MNIRRVTAGRATAMLFLVLVSLASGLRNTSFMKLVPIPTKVCLPGQACKSINSGLTSPSSDFMLRLLGRPGKLSTNCDRSISPHLSKLIISDSVGPFRVTGLKPAVTALRRIFARVRSEESKLYTQLGSAGMLCIRAVREYSPPVYSDHSWGTAIDITISGQLVPFRSMVTSVGLLALYPYFHAEKFIWGAGFSRGRTDPMHFEASRELLEEWVAAGLLNY